MIVAVELTHRQVRDLLPEDLREAWDSLSQQATPQGRLARRQAERLVGHRIQRIIDEQVAP